MYLLHFNVKVLNKPRFRSKFTTIIEIKDCRFETVLLKNGELIKYHLNMEKIIQQVIASYKDNLNVLKTSKMHQISRSKVRKILISEGFIDSPLIGNIERLLQEGKSKNQICILLKISSSTFNDNVAYNKGIYHRKERSKQALRSERFRIKELRAIKRNKNLMKEGKKHEQQMLQNNR